MGESHISTKVFVSLIRIIACNCTCISVSRTFEWFLYKHMFKKLMIWNTIVDMHSDILTPTIIYCSHRLTTILHHLFTNYTTRKLSFFIFARVIIWSILCICEQRMPIWVSTFVIPESPTQFENRIKPRVYARHIVRKSSILLAGKGVRKISF